MFHSCLNVRLIWTVIFYSCWNPCQTGSSHIPVVRGGPGRLHLSLACQDLRVECGLERESVCVCLRGGGRQTVCVHTLVCVYVSAAKCILWQRFPTGYMGRLRSLPWKMQGFHYRYSEYRLSHFSLLYKLLEDTEPAFLSTFGQITTRDK